MRGMLLLGLVTAAACGEPRFENGTLNATLSGAQNAGASPFSTTANSATAFFAVNGRINHVFSSVGARDLAISIGAVSGPQGSETVAYQLDALLEPQTPAAIGTLHVVVVATVRFSPPTL
jgi:hypothetical protein